MILVAALADNEISKAAARRAGVKELPVMRTQQFSVPELRLGAYQPAKVFRRSR
jgi:hypothetical protein